jgi:hypothetical protein
MILPLRNGPEDEKDVSRLKNDYDLIDMLSAKPNKYQAFVHH